MRTAITLFALLSLALFAASVFEAKGESFYTEGVRVYCTGDICK